MKSKHAALGVVMAVGLGLLLHHTLGRPAQALAVGPGPSAVASSSAPSKPPQVKARILDAAGEPVHAAHVRVLMASRVAAESLTDAHGTCSFDGLPEGAAQLESDAPDGAVDSAPFSVTEATTELTLVLEPAAVRGSVVDEADGHPIPSAVITPEGPFAMAAAQADASGLFRLSAVPFEARTLVAIAPGYRPARVALGTREGEEPSVRIALRAGPPVVGDVVDPDGKPVHASVIACEGQPSEARVDSKDDGTFQLPPQAIGCDAVATHEDMAPSDPVRVVEGGHLALRLGVGGSIAGTVVDDRGRSLDSFAVGVESFVPVRGSGMGRGGTAPFTAGSFRLERLVPGTYILTAVAPGLPPAHSGPVAVRAGAVTDGVRIVLLRGGVVEGHVSDDHGAPVADAELRFDLVSSVAGSDAQTKTDATGHYRLEGAPAGPFTLLARKDGFRTKLVPGLVVASGATLTEDFTLAQGNGGLELAGIGANLQPTREGIVFARVFEGDPAARAGLQAGDRLTRIDGESASGMSLADAIQRLRGQPGTVVGISVDRAGTPLDVVVTRATVVH